MKSVWLSAIFIMVSSLKIKKEDFHPHRKPQLPINENLIIITTDGFRWQELFTGADSLLINHDGFTPDKETIKALYWAGTPHERRKKLMPFFWNVISAKGQLYGNRAFGNKINTANPYTISYPGYNEILTGNIDPGVSSNRKQHNPNINVLEYLNSRPSFNGKVAAFTSWDVFPYIFNVKRNGLPVNSGYTNMEGDFLSPEQSVINQVQSGDIIEKKNTRFDELTFLTAKEYIRKHHPKVLFLGLGETDEFAHDGRYDLYLNQAAKFDQMVAELWHFLQTTPGYKNNTTMLITTDHGRGKKAGTWDSHGQFINGSSQAWFAVLGPGIKPAGEIKEKQQFYQQQLAQTIAGLLGEDFNDAPAGSVSLH
jgi:hypothetical protein